MYKLIGLIYFRPDLSREESAGHWRKQHGPLVSRIPGLVSYVQNFVEEGLPPQDGAQPANPGYDGYMWHLYPDKATMEKASESPEWQAVVADGATFIDQSASNMGPADEIVVTDGKRGAYKVAVLSASSDPQRQPSPVPGASRYVVNRLHFPGSDGTTDRILEEFWFSSSADYQLVAASPEWKQRLNGTAVQALWSGSATEVTVLG
jgi:uncharacterized protein (TIGR02118 family)